MAELVYLIPSDAFGPPLKTSLALHRSASTPVGDATRRLSNKIHQQLPTPPPAAACANVILTDTPRAAATEPTAPHNITHLGNSPPKHATVIFAWVLGSQSSKAWCQTSVS